MATALTPRIRRSYAAAVVWMLVFLAGGLGLSLVVARAAILDSRRDGPWESTVFLVIVSVAGTLMTIVGARGLLTRVSYVCPWCSAAQNWALASRPLSTRVGQIHYCYSCGRRVDGKDADGLAAKKPQFADPLA